jgi:hypothetical protein
MEVSNNVLVTLTPNEVKKIIKEYLINQKNIVVNNVKINLVTGSAPNDIFGQLADVTYLRDITCYG